MADVPDGVVVEAATRQRGTALVICRGGQSLVAAVPGDKVGQPEDARVDVVVQRIQVDRAAQHCRDLARGVRLDLHHPDGPGSTDRRLLKSALLGPDCQREGRFQTVLPRLRRSQVARLIGVVGSGRRPRSDLAAVLDGRVIGRIGAAAAGLAPQPITLGCPYG